MPNDKDVNENFMNENWWETATVEDIEAEIARGADILAEYKKGGATLLHIAAAVTDSPEVIKFLVNHGISVDGKDNEGRTPLIMAAETNNNPKIIKILVELGANIDIKAHKCTVLEFAAIHNPNIEIIKTLVNLGADVNAKHEINSALEWAVANNPNPEIIKFLLKEDKITDRTFLVHKAAFGNTTEILDMFLESTADLNALLIDASANKHAGVIRYLVERGANINARDAEYNWNNTVLMCAVEWENLWAVKILIELGADVKAKNAIGETALDLAKSVKNHEIIQILQENGAE